jgi:hypothetical protein
MVKKQAGLINSGIIRVFRPEYFEALNDLAREIQKLSRVGGGTHDGKGKSQARDSDEHHDVPHGRSTFGDDCHGAQSPRKRQLRATLKEYGMVKPHAERAG